MSDPGSDSSPSRSRPDRGAVIGAGGTWLAKWSVILVAIAAGTVVLAWIAAQLWVIVLPVLLAVVLCTVLWPPARLLMDRVGLPPAASATTTLLLFLALASGVVALIVPPVLNQMPELIDQATAGISRLQEWIAGPPINLRQEQFDGYVDTVVNAMRESSSAIASGVVTGVSTVGTLVLTLLLTIVLSFFFLKDGRRFLPWLTRTTGSRAGRHLAEVLAEMWKNLGGFIRAQAAVSLIDAVFIGAGLLILGVPLAPVLAVLTFIGGFVPFVGAFVAGALAVLIALVANGFTNALLVLALIIAVQQIEGNVLQPILQSRTMKLHPVLVLLGVTAGGSLFGIVGAFLAVPTVAMVAVVARYVNEQIDLRADETDEIEDPEEAEENAVPANDSGDP
ncbi:AI-2E family transporter [[Mycobacterium] burgundiense]|uniref:AI-2E family transporter n=1 Tax=[Mycobacterium] burgundiense TaxID=3064286 RepID=A0ABM9LZ94_9MYCO|nr:AI-2E family transporter [Mycolicibacterium sp. MU0053]CAJ1507325.1 AI-2E family transporter [Mycolicibacterium sp. MU0053]